MKKETLIVTILSVLTVLLMGITVCLFLLVLKKTDVKSSEPVVVNEVQEDVVGEVEDVEVTEVEETLEVEGKPDSFDDNGLNEALQNSEESGITATMDIPPVLDELDFLSDEAKSQLTPQYLQECFASNYPFPTEIYLDHADSYDDHYVIYFGTKNSDVQLVFMYENDTLQQYENATNIYGSDYSLVYFNNGVPDNSIDIYNAMYENAITWDCYVTDYVAGNTCTITNYNTGEEITFNIY